MKVFLNGHLVSDVNAVISVFDHGFLYGFGLFETMRSYSGRLFLFSKHYDRLKTSAEIYGIKMTKTAAELEKDIYKTLSANQLSDAYIRVTLSGGPAQLGLQGEEHDQPTWVIMAKPIGSLPQKKNLITLRLPRAGKEAPLRVKSLSFAGNMLAKKEQFQRGNIQAEGLFLNDEGFIVEGTVSNLFFVRDGTIFTPSTDTGLLAGVTRGFIIEQCLKLGIQVNEGFYTLEDLQGIDEAFLSNSVQEIVPIEQIDHQILPCGLGPITQQLMEDYKQTINELNGRGMKDGEDSNDR